MGNHSIRFPDQTPNVALKGHERRLICHHVIGDPGDVGCDLLEAVAGVAQELQLPHNGAIILNDVPKELDHLWLVLFWQEGV